LSLARAGWPALKLPPRGIARPRSKCIEILLHGTKVQLQAGVDLLALHFAGEGPSRSRRDAHTVSATNARIAVVDDDESVRRATWRLLRAAGFEVETYSSGAEFLDAVKHCRPGCVIVDLHMPGMSGLEVQSMLALSGLEIPVLFITAYDDPGARDRAVQAGAVRYLRKPFSEEALLEAIDSAVSSAAGEPGNVSGA
jgi:CheY-like chemotaxis protein